MCRHRVLLCALVVLGAASLAACRKGNGAGKRWKLVKPFQLTLASHRLLERLALQKDVLQKQLHEKLQKSGAFVLVGRKDDDPERFGVQISLWMRRGLLDKEKKPTPPVLRIRLRARILFHLLPKRRDRELVIVREEKVKTVVLRKAALRGRSVRREFLHQERSFVRALWEQGTASLLLYAKMRRLPSKTLRKHLEGEAKRERLHAARLLGKRKYKPALKGLLRLLKSQDKGEALVALGALVKLRDRRAVLPLIEFARGKQPTFLVQIISVLAEIGGEQAASYLFTLSGAHPMQVVRRTAKEALEEIRQREKAKPRSVPRRAMPASRTSSSG